MLWNVLMTADSSNTLAYSQEEIADRNSKNLACSEALGRQIHTKFQRPVFDYNIIVTYGQSLSNGFLSTPALSVMSRASGLYMLGASVRPMAVTGGTTFAPVGGRSVLMPLAACVQDFDGNVITDYSKLGPNDHALGESLSEAQAAFIKITIARQMNLPDDDGPQFVAINCGVDGKIVEELSKGAVVNFYNRLVDAVTQIKEIATSQGKTCGVVMFNYNQGESNYYGTRDATQDKDEYKALLLSLIQNAQTDLALITGQALPFLTLLGQTGAVFTSDSANLSIGTAQLEMSQQNANIRMATPYYALPSRPDGHLLANGARWFGCMFGKIGFRLLQGEDWQPLSLRHATYREREVLLDVLVPKPPIRFALPFVGDVQTDIVTKGFSFIDAAGVMLPIAASIVSDTQLLLTLPREPSGPLNVRIADNTHSLGRTCVQDSDDTVSLEQYDYSANGGQSDAENIEELVNKPYPLQNWLAAGQFSVTHA
jgi:hypothetical protein